MNRITSLTFSLTLFAAACSSSSSDDKPTAENYDDTAQAIAMTTAGSGTSGSNATDSSRGGDIASMSDTVSLSLGVLPTGISLSGNGHFQAKRLGVDYDYSLTCKNVAGVAGVCGLTTDQATASITWSGELATAAVSAQVSRTGNWTVTGLQGSSSSFSGTSTFSLDATVQSIFRPGASATFSFDANATYSAVVVSKEERRATSGTVDFAITANDTVTGSAGNKVESSFKAHAQVVFDADETAALTIDGDQHYSINLSTGVVVRVAVN
jgi:hypothetical protein